MLPFIWESLVLFEVVPLTAFSETRKKIRSIRIFPRSCRFGRAELNFKQAPVSTCCLFCSCFYFASMFWLESIHPLSYIQRSGMAPFHKLQSLSFSLTPNLPWVSGIVSFVTSSLWLPKWQKRFTKYYYLTIYQHVRAKRQFLRAKFFKHEQNYPFFMRVEQSRI